MDATADLPLPLPMQPPVSRCTIRRILPIIVAGMMIMISMLANYSVAWIATMCCYCCMAAWRGCKLWCRVILIMAVITHLEWFVAESTDVMTLARIRTGINPGARLWISRASEPIVYNGVDIRQIEMLDSSFFNTTLTTQLELVTNIVTPIQAYTYITHLRDNIECIVSDTMADNAKLTAWRRCFIIDVYITRKAGEYFAQSSFLYRWSVLIQLAVYTYTPYRYITTPFWAARDHIIDRVYTIVRAATALTIRLIADELCVFVSTRNAQIYTTDGTPSDTNASADKIGISLSSLFTGTKIPRGIVASLSKDGFLELEKWICESTKKRHVHSSA